MTPKQRAELRQLIIDRGGMDPTVTVASVLRACIPFTSGQVGCEMRRMCCPKRGRGAPGCKRPSWNLTVGGYLVCIRRLDGAPITPSELQRVQRALSQRRVSDSAGEAVEEFFK